MRYQIRNQILGIFPTIIDGINYIRKTDTINSHTVYQDILLALQTIRETLENSLSEDRLIFYKKQIVDLEETLEIKTRENKENKNTLKRLQRFKELLKNLEKSLEEEEEAKLEVLFLPYKYSMWDSLESVWKAANDDPKCDCYVMPIPYYERNNEGRLAEFHYEGRDFVSNGISIVSYKEYDVVKRKPDIIYFHNPYDGENLVTSVSPEFYSDNLKRYTDMLVYVPYFISGPYENAEQSASYCLNSGVLNAKKVIVQSEILKDVYIKNGVDGGKIVVLGSPKIDAVLKRDKDVILPLEWKEKIEGKKVVLLNNSIGNLLSTTNYYMEDLKNNIETILDNENIILIWRPHPLLEATIKSMRGELHEKFIELKKTFINSKNGILDESADGSRAFAVSDGMISDYSSLIQSYIMSGKPILIMGLSRKLKRKSLLSSDIFSCYFNEEINISSFLKMIIDNNDPEKGQRINDFEKSIVNTDGSCGLKVHTHIVDQMKGVLNFNLENK
ncbi:succinyl-CoA ligase [Oceanobacillus picturae]|uniref:Succinyl-CoA ligase n=1 Tax=Oceanobacillus picturae TaxID=171693 RepID=A0A0U9HFX5_9BACI|nr:CDP-glycerol glycerophosphotransferase family protein [Oceanobacillus picturae]GAQ19160.1 succinyl-CoA ligase [Oceanobacillus picturae]